MYVYDYHLLCEGVSTLKLKNENCCPYHVDAAHLGIQPLPWVEHSCCGHFLSQRDYPTKETVQ